jgi:RimJ/RimL family protein N-acetyltransferase
MLKGEHVILRPPKREYIDAFLKWMNDPEITQYLVMVRPLTREMEEEWYDNIKNRDDFFLFSIFVPEENDEDKLIGNCSIGVNWRYKVGKCGIVIGEKEFHGKGYGTEAMKLLIKYGFDTLNLNRIELETHEFNERAYKSYLKVGFKEEGRRRQAHYINGKYHDSSMMGILREEWEIK